MFIALAIFVFRLKAWEHLAQGKEAWRRRPGSSPKTSQPEGLTTSFPTLGSQSFRLLGLAIREPRVTPKRLTLG